MDIFVICDIDPRIMPGLWFQASREQGRDRSCGSVEWLCSLTNVPQFSSAHNHVQVSAKPG
ncbi:hypothetical protein BpHYR1_028853 [Brachionus plicatilis]|uniref:Uncharacterized protein n=1 Tax=Brachionus plicatilis TaxID=10195 RepID=A0A3M7R1Z0_BRAPC|nr:hypothetical protein BpHYR1_028853 [Brachionus plicatilis]